MKTEGLKYLMMWEGPRKHKYRRRPLRDSIDVKELNLIIKLILFVTQLQECPLIPPLSSLGSNQKKCI